MGIIAQTRLTVREESIQQPEVGEHYRGEPTPPRRGIQERFWTEEVQSGEASFRVLPLGV